MRTKDRPLFLKRALESILSQTHTSWQAIVVHDGPKQVELEKLVAPYIKRANGRIFLRHYKRTTEQGLGALLNYGIQKTRSKFIAIHDDDDTWDPRFLERCLQEVQENQAIVTQAKQVTEFFYQNTIQEHGRDLYNDGLKYGVSLFRQAGGITFPSISFLFRRSVWQELGKFQENLSMREDWEFSLRLLLRYPIPVLPEPLAYIHIRFDGYKEKYRPGTVNLFFNGDKRYAAEIAVKNRLLLQDLQAGKVGLGYVSSISSAAILNHELAAYDDVIETVLTSCSVADEKRGAVNKIDRKEKTEEILHVAYAVDESFAFPLSVSLRSLLENHHSDTKIHVHILDSGISAKSRALIMRSLLKDVPAEIFWLQYESSKLAHLEFPVGRPRSAFGRILLPEILSPAIEKVLYLDADTLVLANVEELFSLECKEYAMYAAQDFKGYFNSPVMGLTQLERFQVPPRAKYFNSGVLLLNLAYWRQNAISQKILSFMQSYPDTLYQNDQNPINICLYNRVGEFSFSWNYQLPDARADWIYSPIQVPKEPMKIIHFVSSEKPWLADYRRPFKKLYREYAARTAWNLDDALGVKTCL